MSRVKDLHHDEIAEQAERDEGNPSASPQHGEDNSAGDDKAPVEAAF